MTDIDWSIKAISDEEAIAEMVGSGLTHDQAAKRLSDTEVIFACSHQWVDRPDGGATDCSKCQGVKILDVEKFANSLRADK